MTNLDFNCYALLFLNKSGNAYFYSLVADSDPGGSHTQRENHPGYLWTDSSIWHLNLSKFQNHLEFFLFFEREWKTGGETAKHGDWERRYFCVSKTPLRYHQAWISGPLSQGPFHWVKWWLDWIYILNGSVVSLWALEGEKARPVGWLFQSSQRVWWFHHGGWPWFGHRAGRMGYGTEEKIPCVCAKSTGKTGCPYWFGKTEGDTDLGRKTRTFIFHMSFIFHLLNVKVSKWKSSWVDSWIGEF